LQGARAGLVHFPKRTLVGGREGTTGIISTDAVLILLVFSHRIITDFLVGTIKSFHLLRWNGICPQGLGSEGNLFSASGNSSTSMLPIIFSLECSVKFQLVQSMTILVLIVIMTIYKNLNNFPHRDSA
jgi:hypothetical protein